MERWHRAFTKNDTEFKQLFGVKKEIFHEMLAVLTVARQERRRKGGRNPKLSVGDQLFLTLQYWREYRTMEHLAYDFDVAKVRSAIRLSWSKMCWFRLERFVYRAKKRCFPKKTPVESWPSMSRKARLNVLKKTKKVVFGQEKMTYNKNANHC